MKRIRVAKPPHDEERPFVSRTAIYVAAGRAVGAREPDPAARNPDDLAERLLGDPAAFDLDLPIVHALRQPYAEAMQNLEVVGNVRMMIVRTRFIDEAMLRAVAAGATQVVVLGAGFDSHAYRFAKQLRRCRVFEVDRPAMQALKRRRVREALGAPPANLSYVAVDFKQEVLEQALLRHGYDFKQRTFFAMEGLTMYLTEEALRGTLTTIALHPRGSSVAFDFVTDTLVRMLRHVDLAALPAVSRQHLERFLYLIRDEPWLFGFPYGGEREYLRRLGLEVDELLAIGGPASVKRYLTRADGSEVGSAASFAAMGHAAAAATLPRERVQTLNPAMAYQIVEAFVADRLPR